MRVAEEEYSLPQMVRPSGEHLKFGITDDLADPSRRSNSAADPSRSSRQTLCCERAGVPYCLDARRCPP